MTKTLFPQAADELRLNPANTTVRFLRFRNTLRQGQGSIMMAQEFEPELGQKYGSMTKAVFPLN